MEEDLALKTLSEDKLHANLESQLSEVEMLESMFSSSELKIEDKTAIKEIEDYLNGKNSLNNTPCIDLTMNLTIASDKKFELCVNLPHEYPENEPDVFVRNSKLNRTQHTKLNRDLNAHLTSLKGEPCIYSAILWLQENGENYITQEEVIVIDKKKQVEDEKIVRLWIYSHHIYSKTKRKEILDLAHTLKLTGFCMPGKPGVICIEGPSDDCNEWWQAIKSMNWKRIVLKVTEDVKTIRFNTFEEVAFQSNGDRCNHMDIGELHKYLDDHNLSYIFKELFGVEGKS